MTRETPAATGLRLGEELNHGRSFSSLSATLAIVLRSLTTAQRQKKKTKGPRAATRLAAPWRQGTETGSDSILFPLISKVNSQRQLGQR